ncbi:hypothetical protein MKW92_042578 [Papaver armeniacum]|nr:hypothetical protein MKW92_042578 [Papaver armeniacum]
MKSKYARTSDGQRMMATVSSNEFWENVTFSCQVLGPLVEVVRMVDTERKPFMGYIYEAVSRFKCSDQTFKKFFEIFRKRWEKKICHPLHCTGFYLNPKFFYKIPAEKIDSDEAYRVVKEGLYKAMERLIPDPKDYDQAMFDLRTYTDAARSLGSASAIRTRDTMRPHDWWILHGVGVPCLQKFDIRLLSLTVSASPCERNWSTFENLYSKKRNKFLQQKLSESVFIQYNKKLQRRYEEENKYGGDEDVYRPIFLEAFDEDDDWLIPEGGGLVGKVKILLGNKANAAGGAMDVGPSTSDDTNFQFEMDFDKRMQANKRNRADRDESGDEEGDNRIEI